MAAQTVDALFSEVVSTGLCARCGTCVAVCPVGCLEPSADATPEYRGGCTECAACVESCPGRDLPMAELERHSLGNTRSEDDELGFHRAVLAGHASDSRVWSAGTSGGVVTALLCGLLETGLISGAVVTSFDAERPYHPVPVIVRDVSALRAAAQSKYSITPQMAVLRGARPDDELAVVGLPCQVAGIRKASLRGHGLSRVTLTIGLFCLSSFYPDATAFVIEEVLDLSLSDVAGVAYRDGPFPGAFAVTTLSGQRHEIPYPEARAYFRMFRPYRCITCYDWASELADVAVGDLFGDPERPSHSSVLVRSERGAQAVRDVVAAGYLHVEEGDPRAVARNPGFHYKKRGNSTFIADARRHGLPCPSYPAAPSVRPSEKGETCTTS
jgi:coenzyme F420 hydrogenase subunit beta